MARLLKIIGITLILFVWFYSITFLFFGQSVTITGDLKTFNNGQLWLGVQSFLAILAAFSLPVLVLLIALRNNRKFIFLILLIVIGFSVFFSYRRPVKGFTKIPLPPGSTNVSYDYRYSGLGDSPNYLELTFNSNLSEQEIYNFYLPYLKDLALIFEKQEVQQGEGYSYSFGCTNGTNRGITLGEFTYDKTIFLRTTEVWPPCH